jgi:hypothetical protein
MKLIFKSVVIILIIIGSHKIYAAQPNDLLGVYMGRCLWSDGSRTATLVVDNDEGILKAALFGRGVKYSLFTRFFGNSPLYELFDFSDSDFITSIESFIDGAKANWSEITPIEVLHTQDKGVVFTNIQWAKYQYIMWYDINGGLLSTVNYYGERTIRYVCSFTKKAIKKCNTEQRCEYIVEELTEVKN